MHAKKMEAPCKTRDMPWFEDDAPESASLTSGLSLDQMLSKMEPVSAESSSTSDAMVSALFFFADVFSSTLTTAYMVFPFVVNVMTSPASMAACKSSSVSKRYILMKTVLPNPDWRSVAVSVRSTVLAWKSPQKQSLTKRPTRAIGTVSQEKTNMPCHVP